MHQTGIPIDGGTAASLEAAAIADESGAAGVLVSVHYLDDFDQQQVVTETLMVEVAEPMAPTPQAEARPSEEISLVHTPLWLPIFALLFSAVVGVVSGVYPVVQAASLDPIAALKYE